MATTEQKYVDKLKELIEMCFGFIKYMPTAQKLKKELAYLEQQIEAEENEAYLADCIKKAKPNLSKIADVDKELDEIRGIETVSDEEIKNEIVRLTIMVNEKGMSAMGALMTFRDFMKGKHI